MRAAFGFFVSKTNLCSVKYIHYTKSSKLWLCSAPFSHLEGSHKILIFSTIYQQGENYSLSWKGEVGRAPQFLNKDFLLFFSTLTSPRFFFSGEFRESFVITENTFTATSWQCFILIDTSRSRKKHTGNLSVLLCSHGKFTIYPTMNISSSQRSVQFHQFVNLKSLFSSTGRSIDQHSFTGCIYIIFVYLDLIVVEGVGMCTSLHIK